MKKIAFTSNTSWSLWNFRYKLMKCLKDKGYRIFTIAPKDEYSENLKREFEYIAVKNLNRKGMNPFRELKLFLEFIRILKEINPQLVISFTIKPNIYSAFACGLLNIKCINVVTGLGFVYTREGLLKYFIDNLYKISFKFCSKVVVQNREDLKYFIKNKIISKNKVCLIEGSGVDIEKFSPEICLNSSNKKPFTFLMISRLIWHKGIKEYIEAGKKIKEKYPNVRICLLGPFDEENPASIPKNYIEKYQKQGIIEYFGAAKDVRPFICQADCVVLPTYYKEGIPRALLEAMAMEKPIITTNVAGCKDICKNGENGFLINPKDVSNLFSAMEKVLRLNPEERKSLGKKGRETVVRKYSDVIVINKYLNVIENLLT